MRGACFCRKEAMTDSWGAKQHSRSHVVIGNRSQSYNTQQITHKLQNIKQYGSIPVQKYVRAKPHNTHRPQTHQNKHTTEITHNSKLQHFLAHLGWTKARGQLVLSRASGSCLWRQYGGHVPAETDRRRVQLNQEAENVTAAKRARHETGKRRRRASQQRMDMS